MVLHKGVVVEQGSHNELMKLKSHYFELVTAQTAILEEDDEVQGDLGGIPEHRKFSKQMSVISRTSVVSSVHGEADEFIPDSVRLSSYQVEKKKKKSKNKLNAKLGIVKKNSRKRNRKKGIKKKSRIKLKNKRKLYAQ